MADLNIEPLFSGITGMFNVFNGVIGGVATQANNIGQLAGIASVLGFVLLIIGALFVVFRRIIGGFGVAGRVR